MNETLSVLQHTLQASVSPYHCIMEASRQLEEAGFQPLTLTGTWNLKEEQGYYLPVFDSSLMAFTIGRQNGWLSTNDIREMEDMNPLPEEEGGNLYLVNGAMTKLKDAGAFAKEGTESTLEESEQQQPPDNRNRGGLR